MTLCNGKIKLSKKEVAEGIEDGCHLQGIIYCEDCGGSFCSRHAGRMHGTMKCPDTVEGNHSMLKRCNNTVL